MGNAHSTRWHGYAPWPERFLKRIFKDESGCWFLTSVEGRPLKARPIIEDDQGKLEKAPRTAYRFFVGPIPAGLWLYGACPGGEQCINPAHRLLLTPREAGRVIAWRK